MSELSVQAPASLPELFDIPLEIIYELFLAHLTPRDLSSLWSTSHHAYKLLLPIPDYVWKRWMDAEIFNRMFAPRALHSIAPAASALTFSPFVVRFPEWPVDKITDVEWTFKRRMGFCRLFHHPNKIEDFMHDLTLPMEVPYPGKQGYYQIEYSLHAYYEYVWTSPGLIHGLLNSPSVDTPEYQRSFALFLKLALDLNQGLAFEHTFCRSLTEGLSSFVQTAKSRVTTRSNSPFLKEGSVDRRYESCLEDLRTLFPEKCLVFSVFQVPQHPILGMLDQCQELKRYEAICVAGPDFLAILHACSYTVPLETRNNKWSIRKASGHSRRY